MKEKFLAILACTMLAYFCVGCKQEVVGIAPPPSQTTQPHILAIQPDRLEQNSLLFREEPYLPEPFSSHMFDNIIELRTSLANFWDQAVIDTLLLQQFPHISKPEMADIFNAIRQLQINQSTGKTPVLAHLELCACDQVDFSDRILTVLLQTNALLEKVAAPKRSKKIVHTSMGEESYLQTYMLAIALSKVGFKDVDIYGIGSEVMPWNQHESLYKSYFSSLPGIHLVSHFASIYPYLDAIDNGSAHRSHSFDIIDVGPYHEALYPAKAKRFKLSAFIVRGTRFKQVGGYGQYFIVSVGKGRIHQSSCVGNYKDIYENFQVGFHFDENNKGTAMAYAKPFIDNYCSGVISILDAADDNADFESLIRNFSQTWLTGKGLSVESIPKYRTSAWDEFSGLVDMAKAIDVNPVIVLLQSNMIKGPVQYKGQFLALGGKNLSFPSFERYTH